ncbi:FliB family protein [Clostridium botulinum]|uniref:flagellin lysine-N-methylase n=1 Tax=Clostridium botulinum TaxID=1491 RepID=UPI0013F074D7|nr:flagellin lysine-N-methylase [Clostridium botulinum]MBN1042247.1 FliB family protein [Clostridium botulinum]MBY6916287.1 flagellin lysine-N-methylase [Clostridium botulinum]NFL34002.1 FliB family protein [Clostridium botulinum]NFM02634.1 FliB family protein [Clostridium botulinum]NFO41322.1 FliB family protein [Clostridium botulinum]
MERKIKMRYPMYIKEFKCIGGSCEDSCCIGWDVDIDKTTFKQYYKIQDQEMRKMFQKNVHNNTGYCCDDIDYGKVKLKKGKRCPFLDAENYCVIHSKLGEEYLSNVCTSFPRITNRIDGYYEMSLDVACPEAARILLLKKEGIEFNESQETLGKHILSSDIDTKSKEFKDSPVKYFKEIRDLSIKIIKNRKFDLSERLYILGEFLEKLEEELDYNFSNVHKFIKGYNINSIDDSYEKNDMNYILQVSFFKKMVDNLNVFKEIDSTAFKEYTKELMNGFKFDEIKDATENPDFYINAFRSYIENFININSYIFENYLVNFIYKNLFPFSETESAFDGYIMLLTRYSFLRFYLVGRYLNNKIDSPDDVVKFIQVFTKTTEHHKTYLGDTLNHIKRKEFDNLEFAKTLL